MSDHAGSAGAFRTVRATFDSPDRMQDAVGRLTISGFDRGDLGLPAADTAADQIAPLPASTEADARQIRTLGASTAATAAAMAAAGITIATGGAAAPAIAAALLAGGAAGGATFAVQGAANNAEQQSREARAATGDLLLTVRISDAVKQANAEAILQSAGARHIETL